MSGITNIPTRNTANTNRDMNEQTRQKESRAISYYQNNLELSDPAVKQVNRPVQLPSSSARTFLQSARTTQISLTLQQQLAIQFPEQFRIVQNPTLYPPLGFLASGGIMIQGNGFQYHVFLASASFTIVNLAGGKIANYLIVGGGGGGGDRHGAGGGAGGVLSGTFNLTLPSYTITVGAGGLGGYAEGPIGTPAGAGLKGGDSSISGIATAFGGGGGGTADGNPTGTFGSGGGGGGNFFAGIAGTVGQGFSGGSGQNPGGGGGGGAGGAGGNANAGTGGIGTAAFSSHLLTVGYGTTFATSPQSPISGGVAYIAGGGAGNPGATGTLAGGLGGGGTGDFDANNTAGTPNTGGGGGGTRSPGEPMFGKQGGSGLILIWYTP